MGTKNNKPILLLHNAIIVTMDQSSVVFSSGGIVIESDRIKSIGHSREILHEFSSIADSIIDLHGQYILPGLVNTHVHTSQQLGRGIADDVDLVTWLHRRIWPYESNMTEKDSYISALLCGIELIHSGVTCFAEAGGQHVAGMARAVELLGLRACLTESIMDTGDGLPESWSNRSADQCIQSQKEIYEKYNNAAEGRIKIWFGIRQIMNSTDQLLIQTKQTAEELKTGIHMFVYNQFFGGSTSVNLLPALRSIVSRFSHVAEIPLENEVVKSTRGVDHGTVTHLNDLQFLDNNLLAAHAVWVNHDEIGLLSRARVKVSHCPAAAMRMLGFAPVKEMMRAGICVSLGTDGAPSNNRMSIVDEMYLASLINKGREVFTNGTTDPTALPAEVVLQMATINGAKSVLWDNEIGSLEIGKKADLVVIDPCSWTMTPVHDCISSLVYSMRSENIVSVMCNGKWIMKDRKILNVDEGEVILMAKRASSDLLARAGISIPKKMCIL